MKHYNKITVNIEMIYLLIIMSCVHGCALVNTLGVKPHCILHTTQLQSNQSTAAKAPGSWRVVSQHTLRRKAYTPSPAQRRCRSLSPSTQKYLSQPARLTGVCTNHRGAKISIPHTHTVTPVTRYIYPMLSSFLFKRLPWLTVITTCLFN